MASEAEVDLVISTAGALPNLERDLNRIVTTAENGAPEVNIQAGIDARNTVRDLEADLRRVARQAEADPDSTIDLRATLNQARSLQDLDRRLGVVIRQAQNGADPVEIQAALDRANSLRSIHRQLQGVIAVARAAAPPIEIEAEVDQDQLRQATNRLFDVARGAGRAALSVAKFGAVAGAIAGSLVQLTSLLAGIVAAAEQMAPAAAVGVSGLFALSLAAGTTAVAFVGVGDAIKNAFDPDVKPEDLAESLKRLAPEARKFVVELRSMRNGLRRVQQEVQNRFFRDFDDTLRKLSVTTLPSIRGALNSTATVLNEMARGAANAAGQLATDGTLGEALDGATKGLENLKGLPGQIVTALGQLGAAASPAFDKLTRRLDTAATQISEDLARAFESGALEDEIDAAIAAVGQLTRIVGNLFEGLGNIFGALTEDGDGLFNILEKLSESFVKLTASEEFQTILQALSDTASELVDAALPLLQEALVQLAPVIEELAPLVAEFVREVGPELIPVLQELGPILLSIVGILRDQLPFAIEFSKALLQTLTVILKGVAFVIDEIVAPALRLVSRILNSEYVKDIAAASRETSSAIGTILQRFEAFRERASSAIQGVLGRLSDIVNFIRVTFLSEVTGALATVVGRFTSLPGQIRSAIGNVGSLLFSVGADLIRGLIGGILSQVDRLLGIARGIAESVAGTISDALDIASPSRVMRQIGEFTGEGLVQGLRRMIPEVESASLALAGPIAPSFALPGGQSLSLSPLAVGAPNVQVFIGNEQLNGRIDTRINANNRARDRVLSQGIRR